MLQAIYFPHFVTRCRSFSIPNLIMLYRLISSLYLSKIYKSDSPSRVASAFTILELLIVIAVIGIVMGSMSSLSRNYIKDLELKTTKEDLMSQYQIISSKVAGSSYYMGTGFDRYQIDRMTGDRIQTSYRSQWWAILTGENFILRKSYLETVFVGETEVWPINMRMKSYGQWCSIGSWEALMTTWSMMIRLAPIGGSKRYCMSIDLTSCRMKDVSCPRL